MDHTLFRVAPCLLTLRHSFRYNNWMHNMEFGLLILESVLLIATVSLLVMSLKEGRGRDKLIMEVANATKVLSRHEYFTTVVDVMMDAKEEVLASITGRIPGKDDEKRVKDLIYNIEKLVAAGVKVRYILPKFQDRLHVGCLYVNAGAEVSYSPCVLNEDFRYTVADGSMVVVGVPDDKHVTAATGKGYKIPSAGLAVILKDNFQRCEETISFKEYVEETMSHTGASLASIAKEIKLDLTEISKALKK